MKRLQFIFILTLLFAASVFAQKNPYPNEIKGFEFFGKGKLKSIRLGISTKNDLDKIFGKTNDSFYEYNQNWIMSFSLIGADTCFTSETTGEPIRTFCADKNFIGKLYSIELRPKKSISFTKVKFNNFTGYGRGGSYSHDGKGGGTNSSFISHSDNYGLSYSIFDEITLTTEKTPSKLKKGDLISIEYELSKKQKQKIYTEQK